MNNSVTQEGSYLEEKETIFWIASIISFTIHILIFAIAIYGLPNLGRELPENKEKLSKRMDIFSISLENLL